MFAGRVAGAAGVTTVSGTGGGASIPEALFMTWTGAPLDSRYRGLAPALYILQGTDVLLYLYARVCTRMVFNIMGIIRLVSM